MKRSKNLIILLAIFTYGHVKSQVHNQVNWQHKDLKNDNLFGVSSDKAIQSLLNGKPGKLVTVAVIDGGVDIHHRDLQDLIWTNPNEIPDNGLDDDHNGYIDDIHGWNFLGDSKKSFQLDNFDIVRKFRVAYDNKRKSTQYKLFKIQIENKRDVVLKALKESKDQSKAYLTILEKIGKLRPELTDLKNYHFQDINEEKTLLKLIDVVKDKRNLSSFKEVLDARIEDLNNQLDYCLNVDYNPRNGKDFNTKGYGNSDVTGSLAYHGTHVSGIIAAKENLVGGKGISGNARLMILRTVPTGDYLDSEMAMAIRYATDNGAKIINISITKSGAIDPIIIDKAIKYAVSKDVLIIHACGNQGMWLEEGLYPKCIDKNNSAVTRSWIEVGASNCKNDASLAFYTSNFGKAIVDVFAPGVDIFSCTPNNSYAYFSGTSMAAPIVTGIAAVLRSSYPNLNAEQIKECILESVIKVTNNVKIMNGEMVPFHEMCASGGIVNLYKALQFAARLN